MRTVLPRPIIVTISSYLYWFYIQFPPLFQHNANQSAGSGAVRALQITRAAFGSLDAWMGGKNIWKGLIWTLLSLHFPLCLLKAGYSVWKLAFCPESLGEPLVLKPVPCRSNTSHTVLPWSTLSERQGWQNAACTRTPICRQNNHHLFPGLQRQKQKDLYQWETALLEKHIWQSHQ